MSCSTTADCTILTFKPDQPLLNHCITTTSTSDSTTALNTSPYNRCNFLYDAQLNYEQPNPYFVPYVEIGDGMKDMWRKALMEKNLKFEQDPVIKQWIKDLESYENCKEKEKDEMNENNRTYVSYREASLTNFRVLTKEPVIEKAHYPHTMTVTVYYVDKLRPTCEDKLGYTYYYNNSDEQAKTVKLTCIGGDKFDYTKGVNIAIAKVLYGDIYDFNYVELFAYELEHIKSVQKLVNKCIKNYKNKLIAEEKEKQEEIERKEIIKRRKAKKIAKKRRKALEEKQALVDTISDIVKVVK